MFTPDVVQDMILRFGLARQSFSAGVLGEMIDVIFSMNCGGLLEPLRILWQSPETSPHDYTRVCSDAFEMSAHISRCAYVLSIGDLRWSQVRVPLFENSPERAIQQIFFRKQNVFLRACKCSDH